jgi:4-amino-4-deoxy-L-arabinose transferase-like glycosyltransferase
VFGSFSSARRASARSLHALLPTGRFVRSRHRLLLILIGLIGAGVFLLGLGQTGLVDETPALFAASARQMAESGDWLIPQVNGLPRYDKPPLIYWLMGGLYAFPGSDQWDPLGSWAARLPSALASMATMVALGDTLLRWPPSGLAGDGPPAAGLGRVATAINAALAFALGPLMLVWGRTEVSDALFTATLAISLLLAWRTFAAQRGPWWPCWSVLALAVLSKGPVAIVLFALSLGLFWLLGAEADRLRRRLRPFLGIALTVVVSAPWFTLALLREGKPYWDSFFGYHNLQRFSRVVNNHHQGPWYFLVVLVLASLPFTPLLLLSLRRVLLEVRTPLAVPLSLGRFATAWLLAVLLFFSLSATKLPSYWLVATPAAALLVALAPSTAWQPGFGAAQGPQGQRGLRLAMAASSALLVLVSAVLALAPQWLPLINDPTLPGLAAAVGRRPWLYLGAAVTLAAALLLSGMATNRPTARLLQCQAALLLLVPLVLLPVWQIGDQLRGAPIRQLAAVTRAKRSVAEPLAMVGLIKPSLHFYSQSTVLFEGRSPHALVNLADRLRSESRPGLRPSSADRQPTLLLVIDSITANKDHWRNMKGRELAHAGPYRLWRLDRLWLEQRARLLQNQGINPSWRRPRPEMF